MDEAARSEYNRIYYREHLEERRAYQKAYYAQKRNRLLSLHPDEYFEESARRSASANASRERNMVLYGEKQCVIRDARLARGWTQTHLACLLGVTQVCVRYYETGAVKAPWDRLVRIMPELKEVKHEHYI